MSSPVNIDPRFFSKLVCIKCGSTDRNMSGACAPCVRANSKAWYEKNKEKHIKNTTERRRLDPEKHAKRQAKNRLSNLEKARESDRAWYARNSEKVTQAKTEWRNANPEKVKAYSKKWSENNKETICIQSHNRRARVKAVGGRLTRGLSKKLLNLQKGKCPCCKTSIKEKFHMDHIVPIASGGVNEDSNIQLLCPSCNSRKSDIDPIKYMQKLGFLL